MREAGFPAESNITRILVRVRLRSAMIWAGDGEKRAYLNAEHLGTRGPMTGRELEMRTRDPQSAADLDFFLYLTPPNFRPDVVFPIDTRVLSELHGVGVRDLNTLIRDTPPA